MPYRADIIATAGWSIPRSCAARFPEGGTHLQRYSRKLRGVEINSSFYRRHAPTTYERWAKQTPRAFRFAVKLPREITHDGRLRAARRALEQFLDEVAGLGQRLGPLIVQLPPSLPFEPLVASRFFVLLRERHSGAVVCEPRHESWFDAGAEALLLRHRIGRVAADPAVVPAAARPGGWPGIAYYRLHGSPRKYWSVYDEGQLAHWKEALLSKPRTTPAWCVLDNTAGSGATVNALWMQDQLALVAVRRSRTSA